MTYLDFLDNYQGLPVFFECLPGGNNGDLLIERGSRHVHERYGLRYTDTPEGARLILIRGNGAMREHDRAVLGTFKRYAENYPTTPLCMEPTTFDYQSLQLADVLPPRRATTYLFARDRESFHYLQRQRVPGRIEVGLDHDMALALKDSPLVKSLVARRADKILLVERLDIEHPLVGRGHRALALGLYRRLVPRPIRTITTPLLNGIRSRAPGGLKPFMSELADRSFPDLAHLPRLCRDIGDVRTTTFDDFVDTVATSAAIVTTRLHVGLLAAMLGRPTLLIVGDYKKIQWIYDYSLRNLDNVALVTLPR